MYFLPIFNILDFLLFISGFYFGYFHYFLKIKSNFDALSFLEIDNSIREINKRSSNGVYHICLTA